MFSKIFNKKTLLVLLAVFVGLITISVGAGVYADSVATSTTSTSTSTSSSEQTVSCFGGSSWVLWVGILVIFGGMFIINYFKRKKAVEENNKKMEMLIPGTKIKTIGMIDGEIVEVYEDSILLKSGNSTLVVDKRAIWQIIPEQPVEEPEQTEKETDSLAENASQEEPFAEELAKQTEEETLTEQELNAEETEKTEQVEKVEE